MQSPPSDGISSLCWSPASNLLVASSWNNQVLCWDVQANGQSIPKAAITLDKPVLCSAWSNDGSAVFAGDSAPICRELGTGGASCADGCPSAAASGVPPPGRVPPAPPNLPPSMPPTGGCDNGVKMWNLATNQQQQVAQHAAPVRHCIFLQQLNMLVTGSWDKTVKYWDLRSPNPVHTQPMPERVYAMDAVGQLLVVATADRTIQVFNLGSPQTAYKSLTSPLKYQTRCISCFPDSTGYLIGSVEGRVAVHHVEDSLQSKNFTFKCHRCEGASAEQPHPTPVAWCWGRAGQQLMPELLLPELLDSSAASQAAVAMRLAG